VDRLVQLLRDPDDGVAKAATEALVDMRGLIPHGKPGAVRRAAGKRGPWWAPRLFRLNAGSDRET